MADFEKARHVPCLISPVPKSKAQLTMFHNNLIHVFRCSRSNRCPHAPWLVTRSDKFLRSHGNCSLKAAYSHRCCPPVRHLRLCRPPASARCRKTPRVPVPLWNGPRTPLALPSYFCKQVGVFVACLFQHPTADLCYQMWRRFLKHFNFRSPCSPLLASTPRTVTAYSTRSGWTCC